MLKPDEVSRVSGEVIREVHAGDITGIGVKFKKIDEATKGLIRTIMTKPDVLSPYGLNILLWVRNPFR